MATPTKTIVFVRHGHREKFRPDHDNGLSPKGLKQVEDLVQAYLEKKLPSATHFWTSPKLRCRQTLTPLSAIGKNPCLIEPLLDEQSYEDGAKVFVRRVEALVDKACAVGAPVYLCSHGDFIPQAIDILTGIQVDVSKGQAIILTQNNKGKWEIS